MSDNKKLELEGVIIEDPALEMPIGQSLTFSPSLITHSLESQSVWLKEWESFEGILLSIHFANADMQSIEGSAVLVAPGIALCAKHVIDTYLKEIQDGGLGVIVVAINKGALQIWRVVSITYVNNSDLAILILAYASPLPVNNLFKQASVSTRLPKIGEKLLISGFRASSNKFLISNTDGERIMGCSGDVLACNGLVSGRFLEGRDRAMLPWPTLEIDCPSFGGMSGGPVFDSNGMLVGLLSSSFDEGPSYVSLLWPALVTKFTGGWPNSFFSKEKNLLDLSHLSPSLCAIDNPSAISMYKNNINGGIDVAYRIWE